MPRSHHVARIPIAMVYPDDILGNLVNEVFSGEYESGHDGSGLTILDIGANIGAFAVWASLRWPGSTIYSYEANPETFPYLKRNTAADPRIHCTQAAVYPGGQGTMPFFYRFAEREGQKRLARPNWPTWRRSSLNTEHRALKRASRNNPDS